MAGSSHGHTPAAWTGVFIAFIGFGISGVGMVAVNMIAFWGGLAVILLAGVVGMAMRAAGLGKPKESEELVRARAAAANKQVNMRSEDIKAAYLARAESAHTAHEPAKPAALEAQAQTA